MIDNGLGDLASVQIGTVYDNSVIELIAYARTEELQMIPMCVEVS